MCSSASFYETLASDVVVNYKVPRLFFAGGRHWWYTRPSVRYLMGGKGLERVCKLYLKSKTKPLSSNQSMRFKFQEWSGITKEFSKKKKTPSLPWP